MDTLFDHSLLRQRHRRALAATRKQPARDPQFLLRHVATELAERLSMVERHFANPVLLHSATTLPADLLEATGKTDRFLVVAPDRPEDIGPTAGTNSREWVAAPPDEVGLNVASADLFIAPATLHLVNDTPGLLIQVRRALVPDGLFLAAVPGAGTLGELRQSLLQAESEVTGGVHSRIHPFADVRDYGALMQRAGFALPVADCEELVVRYDNLFALMQDLRAMGMTNALVQRSRKPLSRRVLLRAAAIYAERFADPDGRIRASFPMIHLSGWAPDASQQQPLRPGSAKMRLADALRPGGDRK
ncbi:SAM-dependent methyltransferase [Pseudohoeflea coraliihabitans]|uniref:SAM-dependent methyltransferase n=1 Tax=Pseudohoeflea coraliihabitans TaxID=2860393 RepID=A0ABS6WKS3_9HYPH|nr:SAM-dependent methyltransferase [Pseudohoeflea sp. DP4N28-3]MBW3096475.1 SAM-dependent methyltransferase [Pseudohoeflea sp. DP4N28-3]